MDEWSLITKYEAKKTSEEEKILREKLISQRRRIKGELDAQVEEQKRREARSKAEEALWGKQEEKAVEEWKATELVRYIVYVLYSYLFLFYFPYYHI